jgi:hypothetical protein
VLFFVKNSPAKNKEWDFHCLDATTSTGVTEVKGEVFA